MRISLIDGEANLKRHENQDWERVRLNYPLVEGDTLATGKDSRAEIQIDARNFVRLTANTVLRIVTLRDEGIAMSVVEGTALVRLAKFDRDKEYFEIDAPKSTLAAEKTGLYRIDVPREGRVRLTVRDGGSARIYSDTSGFALRSGRSGRTVISGDNAGDWDLQAAADRNDIDNWVNDRERYLAQRMRHDVKIFRQVRVGRGRSGRLWRLELHRRVWLALAATRDGAGQLQRLGPLSLRTLTLVSALRLDVGWL